MAYIGLVYRETQVSDVMGVPPFLVSRCPGDPPSIKNHSPADVKNATEAWRMLICHSASKSYTAVSAASASIVFLFH